MYFHYYCILLYLATKGHLSIVGMTMMLSLPSFSLWLYNFKIGFVFVAVRARALEITRIPWLLLLSKFTVSFPQVDDSYLIQYVPELSRRSPGLVSATLGLDFTIDESHYAPRTKLASDGSSLVQSAQKELWALCEATMPPIKGTTFPFTREIYLGSLSQTFQHFQSDAHRGPQSKSSLELVIKIVLTLIFCRLFRQHVAHNCDCCDDLKRNPSGKLRKKTQREKMKKTQRFETYPCYCSGMQSIKIKMKSLHFSFRNTSKENPRNLSSLDVVSSNKKS